MIAKNYIKYPEALRFQCEMFSNGYHNSPRIMRLVEVIFDWTPTVPQWVKNAKARAKQLVKAWKGRMLEMFDTMKIKAKRIDPRQLELVLFPDQEPKEYWAEVTPPTPEKTPKASSLPTCNPRFRPFLKEEYGTLKCGGHYRIFCNKCHAWATYSSADGGEYANVTSYETK